MKIIKYAIIIVIVFAGVFSIFQAFYLSKSTAISIGNYELGFSETTGAMLCKKTNECINGGIKSGKMQDGYLYLQYSPSFSFSKNKDGTVVIYDNIFRTKIGKISGGHIELEEKKMPKFLILNSLDSNIVGLNKDYEIIYGNIQNESINIGIIHEIENGNKINIGDQQFSTNVSELNNPVDLKKYIKTEAGKLN